MEDYPNQEDVEYAYSRLEHACNVAQTLLGNDMRHASPKNKVRQQELRVAYRCLCEGMCSMLENFSMSKRK